MINKRLFTLVAVFFVGTATACFSTEWTDVTRVFVNNPGFDNNNQNGWSVVSTTNTVGPSAECMRFFNGNCTFSQQLTNLPKGTYRLSVQGFYRAQSDSYQDYKNHTEEITAFLFAGNKSTPLVSVYAEGLRQQGTGNWQNFDGLYFPNNSSSAAYAFQAGLYKGNTIEFEAEGDVTIGIRCENHLNSNYCVADNFKLEYEGQIMKATPESLIINEIMPSNVDEYISPAFNFDGFIELYNPTEFPIELNGQKLSDPVNGEGPWTMPKNMGIVPAKGYRLIWFDSNDIQPLNAPFKLDIDGGVITLSDAEGNNLITQSYPSSLERISYARATDGTGEWGFTATPTPGASNNGIQLLTQQLDAPNVDQPSQLFTGKLNLKVTIPEGTTLRYTTDGTLPTLQNGKTSTDGLFTISRTTNYRFRLFADNKLPSRVTTRSYLYKDKNYYLPIVSVVTDPRFLQSTEIGVFAKGPNGRPGNGQNDKCNWNMNWDRPVNFSYLNGNGEMMLNQDANLEMCGGWSRAWNPRSFKLKGDKELGGDKNLNYPFFEQKPYIRNRTLQIRNGGNDNNCRFRDPALQVIAMSSGLNIDCQSHQPVHEFINGVYAGVLNMREPNNKHYVYANYGWDDEDIDQFEMSPDSGYVQKCGTPDAFNELVDVLSPQAANSATYQEISRMLDIDAYINYMAMQLYLGNWDWPQNNVKGFRHRDGGKFRFVIFDTDGSFNTNTPFDTFMGKETYTFDELRPHGSGLGSITAKIRFVTLFKNLLKNADFRRRFIDAYCIMGGSVFEAKRSADILDELYLRVEPAMNIPPVYYKNQAESASSTYNSVKSDLNNRNSQAISALKNYSTFGLKTTAQQAVTLTSDTPGAKLFINGQVVPTGKFTGNLFAPVTLSAQAPAGYTFKEWVHSTTGTSYSTEEQISLPTGTVRLKACFTPLSDSQKQRYGITPIRINEVSGSNDSYIDEYGKKGDWIELYNTTDQAIDVEGMYLTDNTEKPKKYTITKGNTKAQTVIPAHGYLIVWCDNKRATTDNGLHATFKIDGDGGQVAISAADLSWTDIMTFNAHDANTTIGRYPDGGTTVYAMDVATIGKANMMSSYAIKLRDEQAVAVRAIASAGTSLRMVYGDQQLVVKGSDSQQTTVSLFRTDGTLVSMSTVNLTDGTAYVDVSTLEPGFYVARATDNHGTSVACKFTK